MIWHIITGEFPPQRGGVSDYTFQLAQGLAAWDGEVHVWCPAPASQVDLPEGVYLHGLPGRFGFRWLLSLERGLSSFKGKQTVLVQYVPHMYGWKAMNIAFCGWLACGRKNVWVMFHEVAYPFRSGQPLRHHFLAAVHRCMAWIVLRSASRAYTSIEPYQQTLERLSSKAEPKLLRIFSNVPFRRHHGVKSVRSHSPHFKIGVFSNFAPEVAGLLMDAFAALLENPSFQVRLIGPGERFIEDFVGRFPQFCGRMTTTGHLNAIEIGPHLEACDALLQLYRDGACAARGTFVAALASGVPVVSNHGKLTESMFARRGAVAFSNLDPASLRETLERLQSDPEYAHGIGDAGRRLYSAEFDVEVTVAQLCEAAGLKEKIAVNL